MFSKTSDGNAQGQSVSPKTISGRNIFDWIFFLRPILHPPVWTIAILGYFRSPVKPESPYQLIWIMLASSGMAAWAYVINQIADVESDRRNNKLFFLPLGLISIKAAHIYAGLILAATVAGSFLVSTRAGIIGVAGVAFGYLYSGRPFRGEKDPVAGALLNGIGYGSLIFIFAFTGAGGLIGDAILLSVPYLFAVIAVFMGTTLPDVEGDARSGKRTPAVVLGIRFTTVVMTLSLIVSLFLSLMVRDLPLLLACNLSLPFYLYAALKPKVKNSVFAARFSVLLLSLAACYAFFWYALILLFLFVTARIYYRGRFGIVYPALS
jgi:4-hydroxybenzoate polyprenyltransferase